MLQIKNTLGGGKPEGLYVWKKSSVACIDSITTQTGKNYTLGNATSDTTVYYSTSYTFDETTGTYTLVNPKSATLQYAQWSVYSVEMVKSNYYIWGSISSNEIYTTNASSTYNVYLKNSDGKVFLESDSANYKYDIHSAKIEYTFLDYVVSDKETAYPDGGEKGGYWYERVVGDGLTPEMFGCTKMAVDKYTFASSSKLNGNIPHSLGEIPKYLFILTGVDDPTSDSNLYFVAYRGATLKKSPSAMDGFFEYKSSNTWNNNTARLYNSDTEIKLTFTNYYCIPGIEYTFITMA